MSAMYDDFATAKEDASWKSWVTCDEYLDVLVLVIVLIEDPLTIKRMLTTRHPYTRDHFLHQSLKKLT